MKKLIQALTGKGNKKKDCCKVEIKEKEEKK
ncbi:hypothetical protein N783_03455 [Pontibacillus marinus BH030004 = DSM 16465]|uniref:Uncharacterized protein n=1 Tax=Pontibacillus marinus BH030004 = DSM 16465 TaxID=1385511 RepID=A0A0A5GFP8_9BACI|nr:hypothetical protein N783_03455 [Pontibacillus marinus BH030004 = DSM 16465]